jgi:hypothetical protein
MTASYRSFAQQSAHYMDRPHIGAPTKPIKNAAAWYGPDIEADASQWSYQLTTSESTEIYDAIVRLREANTELGAVTRENFFLPTLASQIKAWRQDIMEEFGLKLIRGLPVKEWSYDEVCYAFWGLGHHLGIPGAQNPDNELLGHVKDYGETADNPFVRLYRTASHIRYHCDACDIVGLLCLQPAVSGGASRVVSTVTLFNELMRVHPDLASRVCEPFRLDRRGETKPGQLPYSMVSPAQFANGKLQTFYHSDYFRSIERHENLVLTDAEKTILDFYDERGLSPELYLDMQLESGDIQFLSNHTIAHSRTAYTDHEDPEKQRHLLRLWLSAE